MFMCHFFIIVTLVVVGVLGSERTLRAESGLSESSEEHSISSTAPFPASSSTTPPPVGPTAPSSGQATVASPRGVVLTPVEHGQDPVVPRSANGSPPSVGVMPAVQMQGVHSAHLEQSHAVPASTTALPGRKLQVRGMVCGAAAVAVLGAGVFFSLETRAYTNSVEAGQVYNPAFADRAKLYETLQWAAYTVGGGLAIASAVLYWVGLSPENTPRVAFVPLPNGGAFIATRRFQ